MMDGSPVNADDRVQAERRGRLAAYRAGPRRSVARWWMIQLRTAGTWETRVIDGAACAGLRIPAGSGSSLHPDLIAVTAVDRVGRTSAASALRLP